MRLFSALLLIVVAGAVHSVADRPAALASSPDDGAFRVVTYNIHKGADIDNRYDLQRTIAAIAELDADVVGVQEAMRNDPGLNCDDQPALIADGLRRLTGQRWWHVYARSWLLQDRTCAASGRGDGQMTEGVAFLTRHRIMSSSEIRLPESRVALLMRVEPMPDVPLVVTHLAASRRNQEHRVRQLGMLLPWVNKHGPGVLMGDLNARAEAGELAPLFSRYKDAWVDAWERGALKGVPSGGTRPFGTSRIDFVFYAVDSPVAVDWAGVIDTDASDHRPVVATFRRRASDPTSLPSIAAAAMSR